MNKKRWYAMDKKRWAVIGGYRCRWCPEEPLFLDADTNGVDEFLMFYRLKFINTDPHRNDYPNGIRSTDITEPEEWRLDISITVECNPAVPPVITITAVQDDLSQFPGKALTEGDMTIHPDLQIFREDALRRFAAAVGGN